VGTALKWLGVALGVTAVLLFVLLGVGWIATSGEYVVPGTITHDHALPRIELPDVTLHGETFGDPATPTVVVLHGGPGNDYRYLLPLKALADQYFLVFYDQRGAGLSPRMPAEAITYEAYMADLDAIVERYRNGRPVKLLAHSWGAMMAATYIGRFPDKVDHVVLAEPGILTSDASKAFLAKTNNMQPPMGVGALWLFGKLWLSATHVDGPDDYAADDWFSGAIMTSPMEGHPIAGYYCGGEVTSGANDAWRFGATAAAALFEEGVAEDGSLKIDLAAGVGNYTRKVLFLSGSCNTIIGPEHQQQFHIPLFPSSELVIVEGSGHTMFGEKPAESIAVVRRYFAEP